MRAAWRCAAWQNSSLCDKLHCGRGPILRRAECFTGALLVRSDQALAALAALQKHVARLHTELGVPQSLSTRAAVAQANKLLGLSSAGPLPVQAKALAAALGTSLD